MKKIRILLLVLVSGLMFGACFEDRDDVIGNASALEIKDFIWKGLNVFYLYKEDVPDLANDRFATQQELNEFLELFGSPSDLFYSLLSSQDQFSFLVDDYVALEQALSGITRHNGLEAGLVRYPNDPSLVFGYVRYVLPNTSAEAQGVQRGMIFNSVDGQQLTEDNYAELLAPDTYSIGLATFDGTEIVPTGESISLTKNQYAENPVYITEVFEIENERIGYLMYNGFTPNFDTELNAAFAYFQSQNITDLVIDVRYNGGGSVETSKDLASMVTGQFNGQIYSTEQWNPDMQSVWQQENPDRLVNRFDNEIRTGAAINNLNLTQLYVLTTRSSASASELLINSLEPYINVIQVGQRTRGKFQASITLYDSPNFGRQNANPGHTYAMQPLVLKSVNAAGNTDYVNGLMPDVEYIEDIANLGTLGTVNEPLLETAINHILGTGRFGSQRIAEPLEEVGETGSRNPLYQKMYIEDVELPEYLHL